MRKRFWYPLTFSLILLALAACTTTGTFSGPTTVTPTTLPTKTASSPTYTPLPPIETPTSPPPTVTTVPAKVMQHYPNGQEFTVTAIHMLDDDTGWAIGGLGALVGDHVLFTSDGGSTWKDVTPPEPQPAPDHMVAAIGYFQDALSAWVTYFIGGGTSLPDQALVWRTSDGGLTWTASQPLDLSGLAEVYMPAVLQFVGQSGWLLAHVGVGLSHDYIALFRITDGGATWKRLIDPYNDSNIQICTKNALFFTDATHGWLTGDCGGVMAGVLLFKTTDAGSTWQMVTLPEPADYPGIFSPESWIACGSYDPFFFSNDLGLIGVNCQDYSGTQVSYFYYVYTTSDGGNSWRSTQYPGERLYFVTPDIGWALASKIQRTTDGGATWTPISNVSWTAQFDFVDANTGWAIARSDNQMALVKSVDGGTRWSILIPTVIH